MGGMVRAGAGEGHVQVRSVGKGAAGPERKNNRFVWRAFNTATDACCVVGPTVGLPDFLQMAARSRNCHLIFSLGAAKQECVTCSSPKGCGQT